MFLGIVLLGLEALGTKGYLVGAGIAAFVTCFVAMSDSSWPVQLGVFFFLSVFFTLIYFKKFRNKLARQAAVLQARLQTPVPAKKHPLTGKIGKVIEAGNGQMSKARVADKIRDVRCKQKLAVNDEVRVRSSDGRTLHVSKLV